MDLEGQAKLGGWGGPTAQHFYAAGAQELGGESPFGSLPVTEGLYRVTQELDSTCMHGE